MKCPHCQSPVGATETACPQCGLCDAALAQILGGDWVRLERITDNARRLTLAETTSIENQLDRFERNFPQCFLAVYLGPLPPPLTVTDLGFWLLNHGAFHTQSISKRNDFGLTLVIDPLKRAAGISVGLALEKFLPEERLGQILHRVRSRLGKGNWASAMERVVHLLIKELSRHAKETKAENPECAPPLGDAGKLGFEPLRPTLHLDNPARNSPHG